MLCANIEITQQQNLPSKICNKCLVLLDNAYKFRKLCKNSDNILQILSNKSNRNSIIVSLDNGKTYKLPEDIKIKVVKVENDPELDLKNNTSIELLNESDCDIIESANDDTEYECFKEEEGINSEEFIEDDDQENSLNSEVLQTKKKITDDKNLKEEDDIESEENVVNIKYEIGKNRSNYICELCGNFYKHRSQLILHMKRHRGDKDVPCEICGKLFFTNALMSRHLRRHSGIRPYKCNYCNRRFYEKGTRHAHEKTHSGARPYVCKLCNKSFVYSHGLTKHMLIHDEKKQYYCDTCKKYFRLKHHLTQHISTFLHKEEVQKQKSELAEQEGIKNI